MKREKFETRGLWIETSKDYNGRYYIAYRPQCSMYFRDRRDLVKWCGYPVKTDTRLSLMSWLDSLEAADAAKGKPANPEQDEALLKATGFGPEQHQDEEDPTANTKMIT